MKKILLTTFVFLVMIGVAYGASTFVTPTDGATLSSAGEVQNFSVTAPFNVTNCTVTGSSVKTGGSFSYAYNLTPATLDVTDNTSNVSSIGVQWDLLRDADDWILTGTCYNGTDDAASNDTITPITVTVDITQPTCTLSGVITGTSYDLASAITVTTTSINGSSSALLYVGGDPVSMTKGTVAESQTYTYDISSFVDGTYAIYSTATDATNTTTCTTIEGVTLTRITGGTSGGGGGYVPPTKAAEVTTDSVLTPPEKDNKILGIPVTFIAIAAIGFFIAKKQKWL